MYLHPIRLSNLITVTIPKQNSLSEQAHQPSSRIKNCIMYHMSTCEHLKKRPVFNSWNQVFQFQFQMIEFPFICIFLDECDVVSIVSKCTWNLWFRHALSAASRWNVMSNKTYVMERSKKKSNRVYHKHKLTMIRNELKFMTMVY